MRRVFTGILVFSLLLASPSVWALDFGLEGAVGAWMQSPDGKLSYEPLTDQDTLDIRDNLNYDDRTGLTARLRIELPSLMPDLYLMYTDVHFQEAGSKDATFTFGDQTFVANTQFDSELELDHLDLALLGSIPFLETASAGKFNIDLGINGRIYFADASIEQDATGIRESESLTLPIPMLFVAAQFRPLDRLSLEAEIRGITYEDDHAYSLIARARFTVWQGLFLAGGYRYDDVDFDQDDVLVDATLKGPFMEAGVKF